MAVKTALDAFIGQLEAAGFAASVDPAELNPNPVAVWVQPRTVGSLTLGGTGTLTAWCYLVCGNFDTAQVLTLLDDALEGLLDMDAVSLSDDAAGTAAVDLAAAVLLPNMTAPLPAYRVAVDLPFDL